MPTEQEIVDYYLAGHTMRAVGRHFNLHYEMARQIILRNGVVSRGAKRQVTSVIPRRLRSECNFGGVYILQGELTRHIKIGTTDNIYTRLYTIQGNSPDRLALVAMFLDATLWFERELHEKCAPYRLHGEWFSEAALKHLHRIGAITPEALEQKNVIDLRLKEATNHSQIELAVPQV